MSEQPDPSDGSEQPVVYTVRFSEYATRELEQILSGSTMFWAVTKPRSSGCRVFTRSSADLPETRKRYAVQPHESRNMGREIRREIYRHTHTTSAPYSGLLYGAG
jgi:hypothetical protein